jgi:hypothetical protein
MIAPWSDDARAEELLDLLAGVITEHGVEGFLRHGVELLEPSERFFPDRLEWSLVGVARLLQRLLRYAGLEDWRLQIEAEPDGGGDPGAPRPGRAGAADQRAADGE